MRRTALPPPPLFVLSQFAVPPGGQACMSAVTITPESQVAEFQLHPATMTPRGGPPLDLVLSAPGYRSVLAVPGGYPGGSVELPISPPRHAEIGSACFVNRGHSAVLLPGSAEARTVARSTTLIDGKSVVGDIALTFSQRAQQSLLSRIGAAFAHASNLTDHLLPAWLIWLIAVLVAFGVPAAVIASLYLALRESERPPARVP
jgi:hypothetical protein